MSREYKLDLKRQGLFRTKGFIGGQWVSASAGRPPFECIDPGTGKSFAKCESMTTEDVELAVKAAHEAFPSFSKEPARERAKKLLEFDRLLRENKEDVARIVVMETGKPLKEALGEIDYALTFSWWMVGEAERSIGQSIPSGTTNTMRYITIQQPIGPVALMVAWNFPVALAVRKIATALAAGCTFVLKPSPESPFSSLALAVLLQEAGFPNGAVNVVTASHETTPEVGAALCKHPDIRKVSFTGSSNIGKPWSPTFNQPSLMLLVSAGRLIMQQCSSTLKKLTLELGGNGAFVIFDDADLKLAVDGLMASKWRHAGQACVTSNRVYVQKGIAPRFVEAFSARMKSDLVVGHGFDDKTTLGALTTPQSVDRAERHLQDAVKRGAKVVVGGNRIAGGGYFFEPTLVVDVDPDAEIAQEETFTPIAALQTFETEDEVIERANATTMGLTSYVYTQNLGRAWRCIEGIESGSVGINAPNVTTAEAPFGGIKASGIGKEAGVGFGISEFQITKTGAFNIA